MEHLKRYGIEYAVLENGMKIVFKKMTGTEDVFASLIVACGPINETKYNNGISHFLEHLFYAGGSPVGGRRQKPSYKMERSGSNYEPAISTEFTEFFLETVKKHFSRDLRLVLNSVGNLTFLKEDFLEEQKAVINEIHNDSDDTIFNAIVLERMFPHHPLGYFIFGRKNRVRSLTPRKIKNWYRRFYQPQRMVLIVVGNVALQKIMRIVKESAIMNLENSVIQSPSVVKVNWRAKPDINNLDTNIAQFIFPMPRNAKDIFFFQYIIDIIHDESIVGPRWSIARKLGIYSTMGCVKYINNCFNYLTIDLEATSHKILKRLEKRFIAWIQKVLKGGFMSDIMIRVYNMKLKETVKGLRDAKWWCEILSDAFTEGFVDCLDLYLNPGSISLEETKQGAERVFRECFGEKYLVFRSLNRKPRDEEQ